MVLGWRRAFCTSISTTEDELKKESKGFTRFGFLSNSGTPRGLRCRTTLTEKVKDKEIESPRVQTPSTFSLIKSSLRISRVRCGICLHSIKTGQGTTIFTSECYHNFHFLCIATFANKQRPITCPTCNSVWKDFQIGEKKQNQRPGLKVYNDDEPLMSPKLVSRFNPIPEDNENEDEFEFCVAKTNDGLSERNGLRNIEVMLLPEAAVVSIGRSHETSAVVLKVRAPPIPAKSSLRVPIDLVTVLDVGSGLSSEKVQTMKRAMRLVVSSLTVTDRLSIVAFGTVSKRLLPLRRMTANGKLSARRIIDALVPTPGKSSANDALKKAAKVLEDRREKNPSATILLLSDSTIVSPTRLAHLDVPIRSLSLDEACCPDSFGLLIVAVLDLRVQIGLVTGSGRAEIAAIYSISTRTIVGPGTIRVGDLYAGEEREFLIELKVSSSHRSHHVLSVKLGHKDTDTQDIISNGKEQGLLVPRPQVIRSSSIERLRCLFFATRAVAESRRLIERGDVNGASQLLNSTRAVLLRSKSIEADRFLVGIEAELVEVHKRRNDTWVVQGSGEEKGEALTPTSAWRAAERLAKVAIMRKSLNRVSDLHGFEDARF